MTPTRMIGLLGAALLVLGVFTPVMTVPNIGGVTYFGYSPCDGLIVLTLACAAACMCISPHRWAMWVPGLVALITTGDSFYNTTLRLAVQRPDGLSSFVGDPFAGLVEGATHNGQWGSGWLILLAGAALVVVAAYVSDREPPRFAARRRAFERREGGDASSGQLPGRV